MDDKRYPNGWDDTSEQLWRQTNDARIAAGHKPQSRHEMAGQLPSNVVELDNALPSVTRRKQTLIDTAVAIYGEDAVSSNNIGYLYSLHASCYLPRRKTTSDNYTHRTGAYSLHVEAGSLLDPNTDEWVKQPLPYGGKPRAFLAYVDTCIKTTASPNVPLGRSFSDFVELMSGSATGGAKGSINAWKTQISALAAANISFGVNFAGERARSKKVPLADEIEVWFSKDKTQLSLFPSELIVSDKYFDSVMRHSMPIDMRAVRALQGNPLATDIYRWLVNRLPKAKAKGEFLTWDILFMQFGGDYKLLKHFKPQFKQALIQAHALYPQAQIQEGDKGFKISQSEPAIATTKRTLIA